MRKLGVCFAVASICVLPLAAFAQDTNEDAELTMPFAAVPPVIDGVISPGEWDDAGEAGGQWSVHDSATPEDQEYHVTVKVKYGVLGLYILFDSNDPNPVCNATGSERLGSGPSESPNYVPTGDINFDWTGYRTVYIDPSGGKTTHSYGLQAMPSNSVLGEVDYQGNSYNYTGVGLYEGLKKRWTDKAEAAAEQGLPEADVAYWAGGISWDMQDSRVFDAMKSDGSGSVMEWFIAYTDMDGFYSNWGTVAGDIADVGLADDAYLVDENGDPATQGIVDPGMEYGFVSGMPAPGTVWEANFGVNEGSSSQWANWVGDTGGFATKPHGKLIFGAAEPTAVRDAINHIMMQ